MNDLQPQQLTTARNSFTSVDKEKKTLNKIVIGICSPCLEFVSAKSDLPASV